jgi:DNA-binding transcriptional ArsR family regulator
MPAVLLNAEDLAKLTVRPLGPFTESLLSLRQLQMRQPSHAVDPWRRRARDRLGPAVTPLLVVAPPCPTIDLPTVVGEAPTFDESMDRLEVAGASHLRSELEYIPPPSGNATWARVWVRDLMDGNRHARRELVQLFQDYHRVVIDPHWNAIRAHVEAERARRGRMMATVGIDGLLTTLHRRIRWRPPLLHVDEAQDDVDGPPRIIALDGRSLVLVPSVFCDDQPHLFHSLDDEASPYVLIYPALRSSADALQLWGSPTQPNRQALGDLLGRTRANALEAIAATCTTTELAWQLGVSPATASHHVGILREAGLIATSRIGNAARHRLTELGVALLDRRRQQP